MESDILALDSALRSEGIPILGCWQCLAENIHDTSGAERPAGAHGIQ